MVEEEAESYEGPGVKDLSPAGPENVGAPESGVGAASAGPTVGPAIGPSSDPAVGPLEIGLGRAELSAPTGNGSGAGSDSGWPAAGARAVGRGPSGIRLGVEAGE